MTRNRAPMHPARQLLVAHLVAGGDRVQAAGPLLLQPRLAAMASGDLPRHKLALPAWPRVANVQAGMVAACQTVAASLAAREHPILLGKSPLHRHLAAQHGLCFLAAEALSREVHLTVPARPGVADLVATVPPAGEQPFAPLPTCDRRAPVGAAPHDGLLAAGARPLRSKGLAGRARPRVALEDAEVRALRGGGSSSIVVVLGRGGAEGLGAGLAARVRGEEEVVGGIAALAAEAGVRDVARRDGVHGLAPRAAPGGVGGVGDGGRGARPPADAGEVEDGVAAGAGPDGVVADYALHRASGQLVLHQLRLRRPMGIRWRGRGCERSPLLRLGGSVTPDSTRPRDGSERPRTNGRCRRRR